MVTQAHDLNKNRIHHQWKMSTKFHLEVKRLLMRLLFSRQDMSEILIIIDYQKYLINLTHPFGWSMIVVVMSFSSASLSTRGTTSLSWSLELEGTESLSSLSSRTPSLIHQTPHVLDAGNPSGLPHGTLELLLSIVFQCALLQSQSRAGPPAMLGKFNSAPLKQ